MDSIPACTLEFSCCKYHLVLKSSCVKSSKVPDVVHLNRPRITFGRVSKVDVQMDSTQMPRMISRHHATMELKNDKWFIQDEKSMNGIYVNNVRVINSHPLACGDELCFGGIVEDAEFEFVLISSSVAAKIPSNFQVEDQANHMPLNTETPPVRRPSSSNNTPGETPNHKLRTISINQPAPCPTVPFPPYLASSMDCHVCKEWIISAANLACGHTYCRLCIDKWLSSGPGASSLTCPVCRTSVRRPPCDNFTVDQVIGEAVRAVEKYLERHPEAIKIAADYALKKKNGDEEDVVKSVGEKRQKTDLVGDENDDFEYSNEKTVHDVVTKRNEYIKRKEEFQIEQTKNKKALENLRSLVGSAKLQGKSFIDIRNTWNDTIKRKFHTKIAQKKNMARQEFCALVGMSEHEILNGEFALLVIMVENVIKPFRPEKTSGMSIVEYEEVMAAYEEKVITVKSLIDSGMSDIKDRLLLFTLYG